MKTLSMDRVVKRPEAQHALLQQAKESSASHKPGPERIRIRIEGKPDARVQVRAGINQATIDRYADEMRLLRDQGKIPAEEFDPVVLFRGDDGELLADGFHRYAAATKAGEPELRAEGIL